MMLRHPSYINYHLKSEVSIMLRCQLCSTCYTAIRIKSCSKRKSAIHAYTEKNGAACPSYYYHLKSEVSITLHCQLRSTRYIAAKIKNCLKSTSAIKLATMKTTDNFHYEGKPSRSTTKSLFAISKNEWDTKVDTGKFMKNTLYVLRYAKRHLLGRSKSNSEKIKPVALAITELRLSESISRVSRKFH